MSGILLGPPPRTMLTLYLACCIASTRLGLNAAVSHVARYGPGQADSSQEIQATEAQGKYAFLRFTAGDTVEARGRDGSWVRCTIVGRDTKSNSYHVRVSDDQGSYVLPSVPSEMLRRLLGPGERDFLVDNSALKHAGVGVRYRSRKTYGATMDEYAPWGTLVSGTDEGDGWVRLGLLDASYLPRTVQGVQVLAPAGRAAAPLPPAGAAAPPPTAGAAAPRGGAGPERPRGAPAYAPGESVEFGQAGVWYPARVAGAGGLPDTYNVVVAPGGDGDALYPVNNVAPKNLRKVQRVEAPKIERIDSPMCKDAACMTLKVKTQSGREFLLQIPGTVKADMLMRMVCNRLRVAWEDCETRFRFAHQDGELNPWTRLEGSGLETGSVLAVEDLAAAQPSPEGLAPGAAPAAGPPPEDFVPVGTEA